MKVLVTMLGVVLLSGCVIPRISRDGFGRPPDAADLAASTIVKGKTTKKNVLDRLGPPGQTMAGSDIPSARAATVWMYQTEYTTEYAGSLGGYPGALFINVSATNYLTEKSYLIVYFDEQDIVTNFVSKRAGTSHNGSEE
jgi:outer membrane protein assembly factor BamE (lipoprotein component of BamABCDE complex)